MADQSNIHGSPSAYDELLHAMLWVAAVETGELPVWEVLWEMRGDMKGWIQSNGLEPEPELARRIIFDLADAGWVRFYRLGPMREELDAVPIDAVRQELVGDWHDAPFVSIAFAASDAGEAECERWRLERTRAGLWSHYPPI